MIYMLKEYTDAFGVSGCEGEIRDIIRKKVDGLGDIAIDTMGNLIVHKKAGSKKVMLAAHMDEVGFIVTKILDDGRIKFSVVGGIDKRILISKRVIFEESRMIGVIGSKPIHLQSSSERTTPVDVNNLFIDIGATTKSEAEQYVSQGEYAVFESDYVDMGNYIKAKALDDRVGCAVVTECLKDVEGLDLYGAFTVQEEIGLRGAGCAAYRIEPEVAIVIEGTTCADIAEDEKDFVTTPGMGPAVSLMDRSSFANRKLLKLIAEEAKKAGISYQYRRADVGGNDAGRIHRAKEGCLTVTISVPTRYIHSPISMINKKDYKDTVELVKRVLIRLKEEF